MRQRRFIQCDVFTAVPTKGNGLAVVVDGDGLADAHMQEFAAWTYLAETTFLLPPTDPSADYKVRIFTPKREMPFAGYPTLGSCAAWLHSGRWQRLSHRGELDQPINELLRPSVYGSPRDSWSSSRLPERLRARPLVTLE